MFLYEAKKKTNRIKIFESEPNNKTSKTRQMTSNHQERQKVRLFRVQLSISEKHLLDWCDIEAKKKRNNTFIF